MTRVLLLLALLSACGDTDGSISLGTIRFDLDATGLKTLALGAAEGWIAVSTEPGAPVRVEAEVFVPRGHARAGSKADRQRDLTVTRGKDRDALFIGGAHAGGDFEYRLRVTAPPGLYLRATMRAGEIDAEGEWRGADLRVTRGKVGLRAAVPPRTDTRCEAAFGAVNVEIPATYCGPVTLSSGDALIDTPQHAALSFGWLYEPDNTSARGLVGPRMSKEERIARQWPETGIWLRADRGAVTFRLTD